ncbi:TonB-dependent receptor [Paracidobacterium acidisoli]|uniref:TonB-dependent receptor n=1 Tax=Paracidobacterium acidisoli TaxID=2303751 RepID=A0A372ILV2_9BACT|nr:TonB-dependent receptor [Paracidobacterium acidisoli]MBT9332531.1 TonB-dependent receptor [Paracidobacterium acidisoli]
MKPRSLYFALILLGAILSALPLPAQVDRANLKGTVTDPNGAVVPRATVTVHFPQTGFTRTVESSSEGEYVLSGLPLGECTLTVSATGLEQKQVDNATLTVGETRTLDVALGVVRAAETVIVNASDVALDRDYASTGGVIGEEQVQNLPINGRNWAGLMVLVPGAINTGSGNQTSIRFAGHGLDDNKILFDGVDATGILRQSEKSDLRIQISSESIAEFRVNSALYSAEFGGVGGGQGDIVSKSGSNQWHGSLYEFLRNDALNARALFSTSQLPLRLNQFGASLGGPIVQDHTFFFLNYEGLRQMVAQPLTGLVPSSSFIQQTLQVEPQLQPLLQAYPAGTAPTSNLNVNNWTGSGRQVQNEDFGLARIDQQFSSKTSAFLRINFDQGRLQAPLGDSSGYLRDTVNTLDAPKNGLISVQHIFGSSLLNETRFSVNRTPFVTQNNSIFPNELQVSGFTTLQDNLEQTQSSTAYSFGDTVNRSFGRHSITTGAGLRRVEINLGNSATTVFSYSSIAKFSVNSMNSASVAAAVPTQGVRKTEYYGFIQDQYKFRPNVTLSLGLRYDYYGVFSEVEGRDKPFDPYTCGGSCPLGSAFYNSDPLDIGPRLAVTWAPAFLHDKTVLRGGYGLYYGEGQLGDLTGPLNNLTTSLALSSTQFPTLSYPIDTFIPLGASTANAPHGLARDRRNEQFDQWGVSVQQQLPLQMLADIGYIGNHGAHITSRTYVNVINPATGTRPLAGFGQVDYKKMGNNSNFSGLSATLNRRFASGWLLGANYLWSHSTNDGSTGGGEQDYPQNVACRICEYGSSDQDIRSSFTSSAVYQLPFGHGQKYFTHGAGGRILGGWQLSGLATARTGLPLNVTVSRSASSMLDGNSTSAQRPDRVAGVSLTPPEGKSPLHWINPAAFATPAKDTWGDASRNPGRGPGTWQLDTSLEKELLGIEKFSLKFRADGFNIFNRAQYGLPVTNWSATNFGVITTQLNAGATGTATQRVFQMSLRLSY